MCLENNEIGGSNCLYFTFFGFPGCYENIVFFILIYELVLVSLVHAAFSTDF